jgi:hypothetical protein
MSVDTKTSVYLGLLSFFWSALFRFWYVFQEHISITLSHSFILSFSKTSSTLTTGYLGLVVDIVVGLLQKWFFNTNYARLSRIYDSYLQLQRMTYEGAGHGNWTHCDSDVPVSSGMDEAGQRLSPSDAWDLLNPTLCRVPAYNSSPSPQDKQQVFENVQLLPHEYYSHQP